MGRKRLQVAARIGMLVLSIDRSTDAGSLAVALGLEDAMQQAVTVLGLGRMGSALAEAFIAAGHDVTAWNRGAKRRAALSSRCHVVDDAAAACAASRLVVVCVADYDATRSILESPGVVEALRGAVLVQLSSGGPKDARTLADFAAQSEFDYLDGAIITYPSRIGDRLTVLVYSGSRVAYDANVETLRALGGRTMFVSDAVGGAAAIDLAFLSFLWGSAAGLLQGAAFCESEHVDPAWFFDAVPSMQIEISAEATYYRQLIARGDYHGDQATLDVHVSSMDHWVATAEQNGINARFPAVLRALFGEAASEHGDEEIAAAIEVFRRP